MKYLLLFLAAAVGWPQAGAPSNQTSESQPDASRLAIHMLQLMESTAVATPGLLQASGPIKQNAESTFAAMQRTPRTPALTWQFMNTIRAYLALADSMPRPNPFPPTADRQSAELRDDLQHMQRDFEETLETQSQNAQTRDADPNQLSRYAEADSKTPSAGTLPRMVFLGDSITEDWRLNEYFTERDLINRGIGGQTTGQMLGRFRQDVLALNPKAVVILGGTNDLERGILLNQISDNLAMMGDLAKAHGIRPAFASLLPVSDYHKDADPRFEMTKTHSPDAIRSLNQWIEAYCRSEGFVYLNYYSAMADASGHMPPDMSDDGLHPNATGYRVMSPVALEALGRLSAAPERSPDAPAKRRLRFLGK